MNKDEHSKTQQDGQERALGWNGMEIMGWIAMGTVVWSGMDAEGQSR